MGDLLLSLFFTRAVFCIIFPVALALCAAEWKEKGGTGRAEQELPREMKELGTGGGDVFLVVAGANHRVCSSRKLSPRTECRLGMSLRSIECDALPLTTVLAVPAKY